MSVRMSPEGKVLRQALFAWAFDPATRDLDPPPEIAAALDSAERASLPVAELEDTLGYAVEQGHLPSNAVDRIQ